MLLNLFIGLVNSFPKLFFYLDNKQKMNSIVIKEEI